MNSFVVPVVAVLIVSESASLWYTPGGIVEAAFYIQAINAFLPDLLSILDFGRIVPYHVFKAFAQTDAWINWCCAAPEFMLALRCVPPRPQFQVGLRLCMQTFVVEHFVVCQQHCLWSFTLRALMGW